MGSQAPHTHAWIQVSTHSDILAGRKRAVCELCGVERKEEAAVLRRSEMPRTWQGADSDLLDWPGSCPNAADLEAPSIPLPEQLAELVQQLRATGREELAGYLEKLASNVEHGG